MIKVKIHSILGLKRAIGQREVEISLQEGSSLSDLISLMVKKWGEELSSQLYQPGTTILYPHIRLAVNGRDIAFLDRMKTVLQDGDEILLFPPVSGG